jgi:Tfp pilus assembly protein PilO
MAALTRTAKKERNARLLGVLALGAIVVLTTTYLLAPRFQEPIRVAEEASNSLGSKILINERVSLLSAQEAKQGGATAELLELQKKFPRDPEVVSLELAINNAIIEVGLSPNALRSLSFQSEFIPILDPLSAINPKSSQPAPAGDGTTQPPQASMYSKSLELSVVGNAASLTLLVDKIIKLERIVVIDTISISFNNQDNTSELKIQGRTFLMPNTVSSETEAIDLNNVDSIIEPGTEVVPEP